MKKGSGTCDSLAAGRPIAILHLQGRYMPGETAEQWRGEGSCERLPLDDFMNLLPHYTIASMVSSKRIEKENEEMNRAKLGVSRHCHCRRHGMKRITEERRISHTCGCCFCFFVLWWQDRLTMENKSHATEIMQKTRLELENGDITSEEIDSAIRVSWKRKDGWMRNNMIVFWFILILWSCRHSVSTRNEWSAWLVDLTRFFGRDGNGQ